MSRTKKLAKDALSWLLCICLVIGWGGVSNLFLDTQEAYALDVGANPTPRVDIAVSLPNDYPGTFLDFKAELTEKLLAQGMSSSDFRITDTATKIDTTDTSNWTVYDHYSSQTEYDKLGYTAEQQKTHPFRQADNSCLGSAVYSGVIPMSKVFGPKSTLPNKTTNKCCNFISHIYSYDDGGKANMVFAGYGTNALVDYMYYPATAQVRRTVSFDLDASVIDKHTLDGAGFLFNCGITNNKLNGYAFYIIPKGSNTNIQQVADAYIYRLSNWDVNSASIAKNQIAKTTIDLGAAKKIRISMDIQQDRVTVQSQPYDKAGNLVGTIPTNNFLNVTTPADAPVENHGGFGPIVGYGSHGCASLSVFKYLDLEMTFDTSAFDALKTVQYYQKADQKYFINLADQKNNSGIPNDNENSFKDGIDRMDQMETFYLSNADDGKVLRDSVVEDGEVKTLGLGATNGCIATGANYVDVMAQYIYQNFLDGAKFQHGPVTSPMPLANFYVKNVGASTPGNPIQLMTVHLKHLQGGKVETGIVGGSHAGTAAGDGGYIKYRRLRVFPDGHPDQAKDSGWKEFEKNADPTTLFEGFFTFTDDMANGKYIFELTVGDNKFNPDIDEEAAENLNHVSSRFQTYVIAFRDEAHPLLEGANTSENVATFTITDTGPGIDEDGITFLTDNRGSGVKAYYITDKPRSVEDPTKNESLWNELPVPQHSINVDYEITSTNPIFVWSKDECGNVGYIAEGETTAHPGEPAVFQPTKVRVEDADGNPIKEYYVIGDKPIIVLPPDDEVPDHPQDPENNKFSGWVSPTPDGGTVDVTPGTESGDTKPVKPDTDHTIVIRPNYSTDMAKIVYLGNGGDVVTPSGSVASYDVVKGSSILKKIEDQGVTAKRTGYSFKGWKLLKGTDPEGDLSNAEDVSTQTASVKDQTYYLVAQWEEGKYSILFNPNGGSSGSAKKIAEVPYGTTIKAGVPLTSAAGLNEIPRSGRGLPNRPGCIFMGWSTKKINPVAAATDLNGQLVATSTESAAGAITSLADTVKMGESDLTLYAAWLIDSTKITVTLDYNDAHSADEESTVAYQEYGPKSVSHTYANLPQARRAGYTFQGWYLQKADGTPDTTKGALSNGVALASADSHTLIALWEADSNTRYTVDYYINSGTKDAAGNFIYSKVNHEGYSKSYTAKTESTVSIAAGDKLDSLSLHGVDYWYNPNSSRVVDGVTVNNNVLSGEVTGSPTLSLKLYYDRYLDVVVQKSAKSTGDGTVSSVRNQREGSKPTATWAAADGSYVSHVLVNGIVRDDLKDKNSYTPEGGLFENTVVTVVFEKGQDTNKPGTPTPAGPKVDPKAYTVSTYIHGCTTSYNGCSITPTQTYKAGEDVTLTLEHQCNKCELLRVEVDGKVINVQDHKIVFEKLSADHVVDVYMTKPIKQAPTLGGQDTEGSYSITVNRYGGDKNFFTSNSRNIALDDTSDGSWSFKWDQKDSTYRLYNIKINGLTQWADGTAPQEGSFDKLKLVPGKNYVIDVYFWDKDDHNQDGKPENVIPDFSRPDQWVHVTTEIVGGAGEIDPGFAEKKTEENKQYEVNYKLENSKDYNNPDYMYYDIESVDVNGQQLTKDQYTTTNDGGNVKVTLKPTTDDAHVKVTVRPVAVPVETMTVSMQTNIVKDGEGNETSRETKVVDPNAGGTIFPSKSVGKYGNYTEIKATPNTVAGYKLKAFEVVDTSDQTKNVAWVWDGSGWQEKKVSDLSQWQLSALSLETEEAGEAEETADEQDVQNAPNQVIVSEPVAAAGNEQAAAAPEAGEAAEAGNGNGESGADGSAGADGGDPSLVQPAPDEQEVQSPALVEPPALPEEPEFVQNAPEVADAAVYQSESGLELAYAEDGGTNGPGNKENVFYEPVGDDSGATVGYVNLTDKQRVVAYFADSNTSNEDVEKTITKPKHEVRVEFEGAGSLTGTYTGAGAVDDSGSTTLSVGDWPKGYEFDGFEIDNPGNCTPGTMTDNAGKKELALSDITGPVTLKVKLKKTDVDSIKTPTPKSGFDKYYTVEAGVEGYGGLTLERKPSSNTIKEGGKYELSWTPKELDKPISADTNIPCIISFTVNGVEQPSFLGKVTSTGHFTIDAVDNDYMIKIKTVLLNEDVDDDGDPDYNIDDDGDGKPDRNVDTDGDGLPDTNVDTDDDGEPDVNVDTDGDGKPDVNIYDEDLDGTPDNVDPKGTNPPKPNVNVDTDGDGKPDLNVDTDGDGKPDVDIVDEDGDGKPDQIDPNNPNPPKPNVNIDTNKDGKPDLNVTVDDDYIPDVNIDTNKDGYPDVNVDTNGDYKPEINIDTDNTGTWKPSAEGGNKDKVWKPDTNIDGGDGKGPIHSDNSAPVDSNHDGVDDRWKPTKIMTADNGFKYGTTAEKWYNDVKPGSPASTTPTKDGKLGKNLPQTGDESDLAIAFTGMLAYTALVVCLFARRKMAQEAAQQPVVRRR